jgi:hypothetical protein
MFLLSQFLAFLSFLSGAFAFQLKERKTVLMFWAGSAFLNSLHFLCLERYTSSVITLIIAARFLLAGRSSEMWKFYFFMAAQLLAGYLTFSGPLSYYPVAASVVGTISVFLLSNANMRIGLAVCSLIWIAHNYQAGTPVGMLSEVIFLVSNAIGFLRLSNRWRAIQSKQNRSPEAPPP